MSALDDRPFPRGALVAAASLVGLSVLAAGAARLGLVGGEPPVPERAVAVQELRFADRADGAVEVFHADDGAPVAVLASGEGGFVRGVLRSLTRERRAQGLGREEPFRLTAWSDGRLWLEDPATGERIDLGAFGKDNRAAFSAFMTDQGDRS